LKETAKARLQLQRLQSKEWKMNKNEQTPEMKSKNPKQQRVGLSEGQPIFWGEYNIIRIQRRDSNRTINIIPALFPQSMKRIDQARKFIGWKDHEAAKDVALVGMEFDDEFVDYAEVGAAAWEGLVRGWKWLKKWKGGIEWLAGRRNLGWRRESWGEWWREKNWKEQMRAFKGE
jgi:hypothetical protein